MQHTASIVYDKPIGPSRPFGAKWTEARREKMIPILKARWTDERRAAQSKMSTNLHKGNTYNLGKTRPAETKHRLREIALAEKAKNIWAAHRAKGPKASSKPVLCIEDGLIYESASAAARHYDVDKSALIELCLGKRNRKTVGGRHFEYVSH